MTKDSTNDDRVAIVTGAAAGIGRATALAFAEAGYRLALVDRDASNLQSVAAKLEKRGTPLVSLAGDLAKMSFVTSVVPRSVEALGRIDVLINNAAIHDGHTMRTATVESWQTILDVNLTAPAFLTQAAAEEMQRRRNGVVLNLSSIEALQPKSLSPAYIASKAALLGLTYNLANLYGPVGIRVVAVCPGAVDTNLSNDYEDDAGRNLSDTIRAETEDRIPLRRWATPDEIAQTLVWLASDGAAYVTGTEIVVDGGYTHHLSRYSLMRQLKPREFE